MLAAKELNTDSVPCVKLEHMSRAQKQAYVLAGNILALNAGWDEVFISTRARVFNGTRCGI